MIVRIDSSPKSISDPRSHANFVEAVPFVHFLRINGCMEAPSRPVLDGVIVSADPQKANHYVSEKR